MTNKELQASRQILFLTTGEAAEHIGEVSQRTWQRWERGDVPVPADVDGEVRSLILNRVEKIEAIEEMISQNKEADVEISYYMTFREYSADHRNATVIDWKISQSIAAEFYANEFASLT